MDKIFSTTKTKFLEILDLYINNKTTYKELKKHALLYDLSKFEDITYMHDYIFNFKLLQYKHVCELERNIRKAKLITQQGHDLCEDDVKLLVTKGQFLGYSKNNFYGRSLPAYPVLNMLVLDEEVVEEKVVEESDEFMFEL